MCIIILFNPTLYAKACLNAISVWSFNVLPLLFPFFVFTRLIVSLNQQRQNFMEKYFSKLYRTPTGSFNTFFLSALSGYPMGAKLICTMHENGQATSKEAEKMLSFCSISGPMFMLGTVGIMMLKSYKAGFIILISNIVASLINGLIFRGKPEKIKQNYHSTKKNTNNLLSESVHDALVSILMVGAYIVLSFLLIELLKNLKIFEIINTAICRVFNLHSSRDVVDSILSGLIEITGGILNLSTTTIPLSLKTIIASSLVGFGGISVMLQSLNFLSALHIPFKTMFVQKLSQAFIALLITTPLALMFL